MLWQDSPEVIKERNDISREMNKLRYIMMTLIPDTLVRFKVMPDIQEAKLFRVNEKEVTNAEYILHALKTRNGEMISAFLRVYEDRYQQYLVQAANQRMKERQ